jgi:two-component system, chemotaxis family, sensor kinase Cph1
VRPTSAGTFANGIDPRHHARTFGLFDQLNPEMDGSGIGLALVKRIVEVHGGRILGESDGAGRGSTFCFTIAMRAFDPCIRRCSEIA